VGYTDTYSLCPVTSFNPMVSSGDSTTVYVTETATNLEFGTHCASPVSLSFQGQAGASHQHSYDGKYITERPMFDAVQNVGCPINYSCSLVSVDNGS
jgi:hypothetical protein